ncbi:TIGR01459 family HAD-type hydrolase [Anderseniella sp. Alg231-50]|uniref:TIGR01459 family HAD-type hydrolase n=1 Tax=Anderseniella sp. Alg231-50 TaxID=1922226 RepID=UPI000D54D36F
MTANSTFSVAEAARELSAAYPVWLCDVWGVVHDGRQVYLAAAEALTRHRERGGCVVLITNAPRPSPVIVPQMQRFGVPDSAYDAVVSSGDVTRELVRRRTGSNLFHLGPDEDTSLLEGLPVSWTALDEAEAVLCTGLNNDGRDGGAAETPDDYRPMLSQMQKRKLPFICANPDRVVGVGGKLYPCAGALAEIYAELGGDVEMAGKPYAPIYQVALERAGDIMKREIGRSQVLAIGDGLPTDVEGARANDLAVHFVTGGIHADDHRGSDAQTIARELAARMPPLRVAGVAGGLVW